MSAEGPLDVAIVGAGAAGLAAAIFLLREEPRLSVLVLETARSPGAKILVSGGGRCNVTNREVGPADFWAPGSAFVRRVLRALPVDETCAFFAELGVTLHEEQDGKLFPDTNRARTVLDALLRETRRRGAELRSGARVARLSRLDEGFALDTAAGPVRARRVLLASGGRSLPKSGSDGHGYALARGLGHGLVEPTPALAPLLLSGEFHAGLSGVALPAEIAIQVAGERSRRVSGSLLFTHFGVSGPAALDASRFWHRATLQGREVSLRVSFRPGLDQAALDERLLGVGRERPRLGCLGALCQDLPESLAAALLRSLGLDPARPLAQLARAERRRLGQALLEWPLPVTGSRGWNFAEATAGGIPLSQVEAATLESRLCPGLHFAGEILDVDGRLGGFNFQWAWASARVAARGLARGLRA